LEFDVSETKTVALRSNYDRARTLMGMAAALTVQTVQDQVAQDTSTAVSYDRVAIAFAAMLSISIPV
jgi:hypothetical protein